MVPLTFTQEQLDFFKFVTAVLDEFPTVLRKVFVCMWDNQVAPTPGYQKWDDTVTVLNLFMSKEGGVKKVPKLNKSYKEWDCTALFRATLFAKSFAIPDGKGGFATLDKLFVKPRNLPSGAFHPSVLSPFGNQAETFALALDQLRLLRNTLCHLSSTREIDKVTFDHYIQLTKDAFGALGQSSTKIDEIGKLGENEFPTARVHQLEEELRRENFKLIKDNLEQLGSQVKDVGSDFKTGATDVKTKVENVGSDVKTKVQDVGSDVKTKVEDVGSDVKTKVEAVRSDVKTKVEDVGSDVKTRVEDVGSDVKTKVEDVGSDVKTKVEDVGSDVKTKVEDVGSDVKTKVEAVRSDVKTKVEDVGSDVKTRVEDVGSDVKTKVEDVGSDVKTKVEDVGSDVKTKVQDVGSDVKTKVQDVGSDVKTKVEDVGSDVKTKVEAVGSDVKTKVEAVRSDVKDVKTKVEAVRSDLKDVKAGVEKVEKIVSDLGLRPSGRHQLKDVKLQIPSTPLCTSDNIVPSDHDQGCVQYKMDEFQIVESMRSYQSGDNRKTAHSCNNYGVDRRDLDRALKSKKKALPKSKKHLHDHPDTAAFLNNSGCSFLEKSDTKSIYHGDFENKIQLKIENLNIALDYILRAIDMLLRLDKKRLGCQTDTATALHNLGCVYLKMCNDEAAVIVFTKATEIRSILLGAHENTACSHHWLGVAQLRTGDLRGALKSLQKAAGMRTRLKSDPKHTACSYHWLGVVKRHTGDQGGALEAQIIALRLMKESLRDHPDTAACYFFLGRVHVELDNDNSAAEAFQKAADKRSNLPDDEDTVEIYHSLGEVQLRLEDPINAVDSLEKTVQLNKKLSGDQSASYVLSLSDLGCAYYKMGNSGLALEAFQEVKNKISKVLLDELKTACNDFNLGAAQFKNGDLEGAKKSLKRASRLNWKVLRNHEASAVSFSTLAGVYLEVGKEKKASKANQKATDIRSQLDSDYVDTRFCFHQVPWGFLARDQRVQQRLSDRWRRP